MPPFAVTVAEPLLPLLQLTLFWAVMAAEMALAGSVIVTVSESVQPLASVAVKVYVPAGNPVAVMPVAPLLQLYITAPVPPVELAVAEPLEPPKQETLVEEAMEATKAAGCKISATAVAVHPLESVTVTV